MIVFLRIVFIVILVAMLAVTGWASSHVALWQVPKTVIGHPWFVATLFDTYFAFLTFWVWVAYKERGWGGRIGWLFAILILGNIAMAVYMLIQLFRLPTNATMEQLFLRRP